MSFYQMKWSFDQNNDHTSFMEQFSVSDKIQKNAFKGISLTTEPLPEATLKRKKGKKLDILIGATEIVISQKFKDLLEQFEEDKGFLEFIPINFNNVIEKDKITPYYFLNILENIEAFDFEKSEYTQLPADIFPDQQHLVQEVKTLFVKEEKIGTRNIFRLKEFAIPVYISEKLKNSVEEAGLEGIEFYQIEAA